MIDAGRLESELRRALVMLERLDAAIDRQNAAAIEAVQEGLIDRDCADDCPQDDTCDCKGTKLISTAINSVASNLHIGDTLRSIRAVLCARCSGTGWYSVPGDLQARCLHRDDNSSNRKEPK